jgi:hypothetical protein
MSMALELIVECCDIIVEEAILFIVAEFKELILIRVE